MHFFSLQNDDIDICMIAISLILLVYGFKLSNLENLKYKIIIIVISFPLIISILPFFTNSYGRWYNIPKHKGVREC